MDEKKSKFDENLYNNIKIKKKELFFRVKITKEVICSNYHRSYKLIIGKHSQNYITNIGDSGY